MSDGKKKIMTMLTKKISTKKSNIHASLKVIKLLMTIIRPVFRDGGHNNILLLSKTLYIIRNGLFYNLNVCISIYYISQCCY